MTDNKQTSKFPITLTKEAQDLLLEQIKKEGLGRDTIRFSIVFGKDQNGKGMYRYNVETVHAPDASVKLDNGLTVVVDGNSSLLVKGTVVDAKEGINNEGEAVTGFVFSNPNAAKPTIEKACQVCPSASDSATTVCNPKDCGSS